MSDSGDNQQVRAGAGKIYFVRFVAKMVKVTRGGLRPNYIPVVAKYGNLSIWRDFGWTDVSLLTHSRLAVSLSACGVPSLLFHLPLVHSFTAPPPLEFIFRILMAIFEEQSKV